MNKPIYPRGVRRRALLTTAAGVALGCGWISARAQGSWPASGQPIRIVVTQGPGAGSDILARLVANEMQGVLNHPVIVENRPGAAGMLGHSFVAKSPADGYTLLLSSTGLLLVTPEISTGVKVHYTDFAPVAGIIEAPYVLLVPEISGAPKTLSQLREQLSATPGAYGSSGVGTMAHLSSSLILQHAGLKASHIPYKANAQVLQDLVGGRLNFACDTVASARPMLESGKLRAIAVTSPQRLSSLPEVPTLAEAGLADTVIATKAGLLAPKRTAPEIIQRLAMAVRKPLEDPRFVARLTGLESPARYLSPADYGKEIEKDARLWTGLVKQLNLRSE